MTWDFEWHLKEQYPGQFVYKMISIDILRDKAVESLLIGKRFYTVNPIEFGTKLYLRFVDNYDQCYMGDPIRSIGWADNGNIIDLITTTDKYKMRVVGGQGLKKTKTGLYEWGKKTE